jgi:hypothetical protein
MRKLGFAMLLAAAVGCSSGGDDTPDRLEFPIDGGTIDMGTLPDAPPVRGNIADFDVCNVDDDCENLESDCRAVPWIGGDKNCIPRCGASTECPFSTYCYPTGGGALGPSFALMGDHCWFSLCGEAFGPAMTPNSRTGGPCQMGVEAGVPISDQLPGWCLPIDDQYFGQCIEVGDLGPGATCDFTTQTRGGANCDATTLCIGMSGASQGTCAEICDPRRLLSDEATGCTQAGQDCQDGSSIITYSDGSTARQTIGFCNDLTACKLIGTNTCPNDTTGAAQGCVLSNSLRPTGICDETGSGPVAVSGTCPAPTMTPPAESQQCTAGSLCNSPDGATFTCQAYCKTAPRACAGASDCAPSESCTGSVCVLNGTFSTGPDVDCTTINPAFTCQPLLWDLGFDNTGGTIDDNLTRDFGTCGM